LLKENWRKDMIEGKMEEGDTFDLKKIEQLTMNNFNKQKITYEVEAP